MSTGNTSDNALAEASSITPLGDHNRTTALCEALGLSDDESYRVTRKALADHAAYAMSLALAEAGPKWISTKDAMPIVGNNVLALWSQSGTCERIYERCYVDEWGFWRYSRTGEQIWNNSVSHWQYVTVPEPPKDTPPCE